MDNNSKQCVHVHVSPLSLVSIMRLTPGPMLVEEAAVTVTVYCVPGLTLTTSACENSKTQTPGHNAHTHLKGAQQCVILVYAVA